MSGTLLASIIILLLAFRPALWPLWIVFSFLVFGMIEAGLSNRLTNYILTTTIILAIIGLAVLIFTYWLVVLAGVPLLIFFYSLLSNLAELRMRYRSRSK